MSSPVRFDRGAIRFSVWVGPGRDPEVAYLDASQLVIAESQLTSRGLLLDPSGTTMNILGGACEGPIDQAVLHRISHAALDRTGEPWFLLDGSDQGCIPVKGLCDLARPDPLPPMPFREQGSFHLDRDFAMQWVTWDDPLRMNVLRRAVYLDVTHLMEAAAGTDGWPRIWPARALGSTHLELVTPRAEDAAIIEERIARTVHHAITRWS